MWFGNERIRLVKANRIYVTDLGKFTRDPGHDVRKDLCYTMYTGQYGVTKLV